MNDDHVHQVYFGQEGDEATRILTRSRIRWIVDKVPGERVLDLGCSQGVASVLLAEQGATVTGVDVEAPAIEFANEVRAKLSADVRSRIQFEEADGIELPFESNSFDHAICSEVLEHVDDPAAVVEEIARVVKVGGLLVVTVPFGVMPHPDHKRVFYPDTIARLLDPVFECEPTTLLERHVGVVGRKRTDATGPPTYSLSSADLSFAERENELRSGLDDTKEALKEANLKYRNATGSLASLREETAKNNQRVADLERDLTAARSKSQELEDQLERESGRDDLASSLLRERVEELRRDADSTRDQLERARSELAELRGRFSERQREADAIEEELRSGRDSAEAELKTTRSDLDQSVDQADRLRGRVTELEARIEADRDQLAAAMEELREGRGANRDKALGRRERRRASSAKHRQKLLDLESRQSELLDALEAGVPDVRSSLDRAQSALSRGHKGDLEVPVPLVGASASVDEDEFERWRRRAAAAPGDEVVFMYSGTIFVQEKRGNRPIRLTRVYLEDERPVFFNYWRWKNDKTGPEWGHPLLYQSPVDETPDLLNRLLTADFGDKRKVMFASFPHELMIRGLAQAAQNGWVTIYDARDDWEEFAKVGMAKWYDPGFEEYLVRQADVVTAVSEPLARKLEEMGDRNGIVVVPNALDSHFPKPPGPRMPENPPIVGYFGHLTPKWFDWDLVIKAARRHPDWTIELAGHQHPDDLDLPGNVRLLGLLGHEDLARHSCRWSFAIIPFKVSALGEAVDPIKVYEYLHLGLPVLSSYMPQMRDYPGTTIAESSEDFLALLPAMPGRKLDLAEVTPWLEKNRWNDRVDEFSRLARIAEAKHRDGRDLRSLLAYPYEHDGEAVR